MAGKRIEFGVPESDARYLIGGFGMPEKRDGRKRRYLGQVARMRVYLPEAQPNRLTLTLWYDRSQKVDILLNGDLLTRLEIQAKSDSQRFHVDVPARVVREHNVFELNCCFPSLQGTLQARCLEVETLEVAEWAERPARSAPKPQTQLYFGDPHVHSAYSPCNRPYGGTRAENYECARNEGWDFIAITDHDTSLTDAMWEESVQAFEAHNDPGKFAALLAYEWTTVLFGQLNVYSYRADLPLLRCTDRAHESPPRLWAALRRCGVPAFTAYHHMVAAGWSGSWDYYDEDMLPLLEVYSGWGQADSMDGHAPETKRAKMSGSLVRNAFARDYRLGFVGGGDGHDGHPGTGGVTGVWATECTAEAIWEALRAKRCYAMSNGQRIELKFSIAGVEMGGQIRFTPYDQDLVFPAPVRACVKGTAPIARIELVENGEVLHAEQYDDGRMETEMQAEIEHVIRKYGMGCSMSNTSRAYYVRVTQTDGSRAWSSPIYFVRDWSGVE